jgi:hypothetical protein
MARKKKAAATTTTTTAPAAKKGKTGGTSLQAGGPSKSTKTTAPAPAPAPAPATQSAPAAQSAPATTPSTIPDKRVTTAPNIGWGTKYTTKNYKKQQVDHDTTSNGLQQMMTDNPGKYSHAVIQ